MAHGCSTLRVSAALPTLDPDLDDILREEAARYVCRACGTADPDPIIGFMDGEVVLACPRCSPAVLPN